MITIGPDGHLHEAEAPDEYEIMMLAQERGCGAVMHICNVFNIKFKRRGGRRTKRGTTLHIPSLALTMRFNKGVLQEVL